MAQGEKVPAVTPDESLLTNLSDDDSIITVSLSLFCEAIGFAKALDKQ